MHPRKSEIDINRELHESGIIIGVNTMQPRLLEAYRKAWKPIKNQFPNIAMMKKHLIRLSQEIQEI